MYAGVNSLDNTRGLGGQGDLGALAQLRILSLPDNQIRQLDSLSGCMALQVVDLSQNYIDDMHPLSLAMPRRLRALNISNNPVGNISGVLHLSALLHLMHIFVSGCNFVSAATEACVDLNPLFAALLPELVTVDNANLSSFQRGQGRILSKHLAVLDQMSNEQAIQFLSSVLTSNSNPVLTSNSNPASSALFTDASASSFSDFVDECEKGQAGGFSIIASSAVTTHPPLPLCAPASALAPAQAFPSTKSVGALAHDITRLKNKLASFTSPVSAPLSRSLVASSLSPLPNHRISQLDSVSNVQRTSTTRFTSQASEVSSVDASNASFSSSGMLHHCASVISRSWRSFRARWLLKSRRNQLGLTHKYPGADPEILCDSSILNRLELLEKTVAVQLQVIEQLHASLQSVGVSSLPVWRIVANASAAATRIQSAWRGHIDREVAQVIRERKRHHVLVANSRNAQGHDPSVAAAAVTITAFVKRKRAQDSSKWLLLTISSQCLYRLVSNMGDRMHAMEQRMMHLEGSALQPATVVSVATSARISLPLHSTS
jgi:Leucine-rich repeat (LRR) protein